jgi:EAL domain-containing protein (putative c-di-GMP-specific phosphodiesterase class I)
VDVGEFALFYQPIISLSSGWIVAFESLIRWNHPTRGMVSPAEFIPVAESTGLILPIGRWALGVAARQLRAWQDEFSLAGKLAVSVNISGRQVADPELLRAAARVMEETELDPGSLKVELTESVVMENVQDVTILLNALRHLGIQIWIDDFGTGYSSLSYLHRFPVDGLKIDKAFVDALDGTQGSEALIRTIVSLASHLGVALVAEGIERKEQADQLSQLGCQAGQGYLFGRPVPAAQARELIARGAVR